MDAKDLTIKAMWTAGKPRNDIAYAVQLDPETVRVRANKMGLGVHPRATCTRDRRVSDAEVSRFIAMREGGASLNEISRATGRGVATVHNALKGRKAPEGIPDEPRPVIPERRLELRDRLYELNYRDITAALMGDPLPGRRELLEQYA